MEEIIAKRQQQVLYDKKWLKLLKRTWLFRYIPFIDLALVAGSMAIGNVGPQSDFDVIIGARKGRIFTARFFSVLAFGLLGWRRRKLSHKEDAADKICLNHFVTKNSFRLSGPHDRYWQKLYSNLVPVFGPDNLVKSFFAANKDWMGEEKIHGDDLRHLHRTSSVFKKIAENILKGGIGFILEEAVKNFQIKRIERGLNNDPPGYNPRIIYNDDELEFHPDTYRTQFYN